MSLKIGIATCIIEKQQSLAMKKSAINKQLL